MYVMLQEGASVCVMWPEGAEYVCVMSSEGASVCVMSPEVWILSMGSYVSLHTLLSLLVGKIRSYLPSLHDTCLHQALE